LQLVISVLARPQVQRYRRQLIHHENREPGPQPFFPLIGQILFNP